MQNYRRLDDTAVLGAMQQVAWFGDGPESDIAKMFISRARPWCVDVQNEFPQQNEEQRKFKHQLEQKFKSQIGNSVFPDTAKLSIYGEIGADDSRAQKRLMIQLPNGKLREITDFSDATIAASHKYRTFERYYFTDEKEFKEAKEIAAKIGGH